MSSNRRFTSGPPDASARRGTIALVASFVLLGAGPPTRACDIEVDPGSTVTISEDRTVDCIIVRAGGRLEIGQPLNLTGPGPSVVDGLVYLYASTSQLHFTTNNHRVLGSGYIRGGDDDADIYIDEDITLTSTPTICGALQIDGPGNFTNWGVVDANSNGTLLVNVGGTLDDNSSGQWRASNGGLLEFGNHLDDQDVRLQLEGDLFISDSGSEIQFDEQPNYSGAASYPFFVTTGHLEMSAGTLDVDEDTQMGTSASELLSMTGGQITVAAGMEFKHH